MKILINRDFYYHNVGTQAYFDKMHKVKEEYAGHWIDVDTETLYKDCYYIKELDICLPDDCVVRVFEDERFKDIYECPECGFQGSFEEMQNHKKENSLLIRKCKNCKFYKFKRVGEMKVDHFKEKVNLTDDSYTEIDNDRYIFNYKKQCDYHYDGSVCKFEECSKADITNPFKDCYFVQHPYGNIFNDFEYNRDLIEFECGTYVCKFYPKIHRITMENSRRKFDIDLPVRKCNSTYVECGWNLIEGGYDSKTLYNLERFVSSKVSDIYSNALRFNLKVTDDWYYTQPDGTVLNEVTINGQTVKRPMPIDWDILGDKNND